MADGESTALETLFSFEVLVEFIRIHKPCVAKRCFEPAVGVRLLDFPTFVIYRGEQEDGRFHEDSDSEKENAANHISSKNNASLQQHMDRSEEYTFKKGKSCLFKINLDLLHTHLSNVPLYVMVLDSRNEIPKLLGSSVISLAKIIDMIKTDVKQLGICTPCAQGEKGLFGVHNLMGEKIGCISLGYKLLCLGASLTQHISESRVLHVGSGKPPVKQPLKSSDNVSETKTCSDEVRTQAHSSNLLCQNVELDGQKTELAVSETEGTQALKRTQAVSTGTQTELARRQLKRMEVELRGFEVEGALNVFCPPPLFYSRFGERQEEGGSDRYEPLIVAVEELRVEDLHAEEEEDEQSLPTVVRRSIAPLEEVHRRRRAAEQPQPAPTLLGEALRRLPILSALLQELSQLNTRPVGPPEASTPVPSGPAWQRQPPAPFAPHPRSPCQSPTSHRGSRSFSPQLKHSPPLGNSAAPPPKNQGKAQRRSVRPQKGSPKPPPKRKLVHGLTRTVRLRLQQLNTDTVREQRGRPCTAVLRLGSRGLPRPSDTKPAPRLSSARKVQAVERSLSLDGNVQTLVSNVDIEPVRMGTPPPSLSGGSERRATRRAGKGENSSVAEFTPHYHRGSKPAAAGSPARSGQNRTVQVRIPSALSQYSYGSEDGGAVRDPGDARPWLINLGFSGGTTSQVCSPIPLFSESRQISPDPGEYPDDFSSLEPTEGFSPDPPDSPEPRVRKRDFDTDSASFERRGTPASLTESDAQERHRTPSSRSESDSQEYGRTHVYAPVKSFSSPQRSLKGTHIIRPRTKASAISLSSEDSEQAGRPTSRPSTLEDSGRSEYARSERFVGKRSNAASPADSRALSIESLSSPPAPAVAAHAEDVDGLGSLGISNKYHDISELVLGKLPGYTL